MSRCVKVFSRMAFLCSVASLPLMAGCSRSDRIATSLVEGTVLSQDGKALERATVVFCQK